MRGSFEGKPTLRHSRSELQAVLCKKHHGRATSQNYCVLNISISLLWSFEGKA